MAKVTTNRAVKTSCKNTKVRTASGACAPERKPMMKSGGTTFGMLSVKAGVDKNPKATAADRIAGAKMGNKKMAVGGTTESCGPGKPKGCGYAKAQRKNSRSKLASKVLPVVGKVLTTAATIGGLAYGAMKGKKMLENKKSGGATKSLPKAQDGKTTGKPTYSENNFNKKSYNPSYMDDFVTKKYKASKSGKVSSSTRRHYEAPTYGGNSLTFVDRKSKSIDTSGYSAGKPNFTVTNVNQREKVWNEPEYTKSTKIISRKDVPKTLESMKKGTGMAKKEAAAKSKSKKK